MDIIMKDAQAFSYRANGNVDQVPLPSPWVLASYTIFQAFFMFGLVYYNVDFLGRSLGIGPANGVRTTYRSLSKYFMWVSAFLFFSFLGFYLMFPDN